MRELQMRWQHSGGKPLTPLMQTVQARRATMYRRTRKSAEFRARRIESMRRGREAARMSRPMPERPPDRPDLRIEIIVRRHDCGELIEHRSEEHTSELQSLMRTSYAVISLKKKK